MIFRGWTQIWIHSKWRNFLFYFEKGMPRWNGRNRESHSEHRSTKNKIARVFHRSVFIWLWCVCIFHYNFHLQEIVGDHFPVLHAQLMLKKIIKFLSCFSLSNGACLECRTCSARRRLNFVRLYEYNPILQSHLASWVTCFITFLNWNNDPLPFSLHQFHHQHSIFNASRILSSSSGSNLSSSSVSASVRAAAKSICLSWRTSQDDVNFIFL